jgi:hypothetical protein
VPPSAEEVEEIEKHYSAQATINTAALDMEKGVVAGRVKNTIIETFKNPRNIGAAALGLVGLWMLVSTFDKPSDGEQTWFKRILGLVGLGAGVSLVVSGMSKDAVSPVDAAESALGGGARLDDIFSSEEMKAVRKEFQARAQSETNDTDATDDFIRMANTDMELAYSVYREALGSHSRELDLTALEGNGLSGKEYSDATAKSSKVALDVFFGKICYEYALKRGDIQATADKTKREQLGSEWALKNFRGHKLGTAFVAMEMVGGELVTATPYGAESLRDPNLIELTRKAPGLRDYLRPSNAPGVYLLKGYPVKYTHRQDGDDVFTDARGGGIAFLEIKGSYGADAITEATQKNIAAAEAAALAMYRGIGSAPTGTLKYKPDGTYALDPAMARPTLAGLPNYKKGETIPVLFFYDAAAGKAHFGTSVSKPAASITELGDAYKERLLTAYTQENTAHVLFGLTSGLKVIMPEVNSGATTEVKFQYGDGHTGKAVYENDALKTLKVDAAADAGLEQAWTEHSHKQVTDFFRKKEVQEAILLATGKFTPNTIGGWYDTLGELFKDGIQWLKDDSIAARFHSEQEKMVIRDIQTMLDTFTGMEVEYVKALFRPVIAPATAWAGEEYTSGQFGIKEKDFFTTKLGVIKGEMTKTVVAAPEADYELKGNESMKIVNTEGKKALEGALAPLRYEDPATKSSRLQAAITAGTNFVTGAGSSTRDEFYKGIFKKFNDQLVLAVNALPSPVLRSSVDKEIERVRKLAETEAITYWGMRDKAAEEKLMLAPLAGTPHEADWKAPTEKVASYISNNIKWEQYGVFPNPENLGIIMGLWYEKIKTGTLAPSAVPGATPDTYADYFMWEVWVRMGGVRDWSTDRIYSETISANSDTQFRENITKLRTLPDYNTWATASHLQMPPVAPGMEAAIDKYRPLAKAHMYEWFKGQNDLPVWRYLDRIGPDMYEWNNVYETSFTRRLEDILLSATDPAVLQKDLEDFKKFVAFEQRAIYEPLIAAGQGPESIFTGFREPWSLFVEEKIIKNFMKDYFYPAPPKTRDFDGYKKYVKANVYDVLNTHFTMPNFPGLPYV